MLRPATWKMIVIVPAAGSESAMVSGKRSPVSLTRRMTNWPAFRFCAIFGASTFIRQMFGASCCFSRMVNTLRLASGGWARRECRVCNLLIVRRSGRTVPQSCRLAHHLTNRPKRTSEMRHLLHPDREHPLQVEFRVGAERDQRLGPLDSLELEHVSGDEVGQFLVRPDADHRHDVERAGDRITSATPSSALSACAVSGIKSRLAEISTNAVTMVQILRLISSSSST